MFFLTTEAVYAEIRKSYYDKKENKSDIQTSKDIRNGTKKIADSTHGPRLSSTDVIVIDNKLYESSASLNGPTNMALTHSPGEQYLIFISN